MSDEIVKALRELDADKPNPWDVCYEAADEIERLTSERDTLRTQLAEANEVAAEAVQWLRVSDLPCGMTIFRADSILEKIEEGETP